MKRPVAVRRLRQLRTATEARAEHFRQATGIRGKQQAQEVEDQAAGFDRDALFLETLAAALEQANDSTSVGEVLQKVHGAHPVTEVAT